MVIVLAIIPVGYNNTVLNEYKTSFIIKGTTLQHLRLKVDFFKIRTF